MTVRSLLENHVLANLLFVLVLVVGTLTYMDLPRQQDPTINFNWIEVTTVFPGASAEDVELRVTDVLEDAVQNVSDTRFISSSSREGISSILVRFEEIGDRTFDKRVADLRREIQNQESELPEDIGDSIITEITTSNAFPTATVVISAPEFNENLRRQGRIIMDDMERLPGVGSILPTALTDPEIKILFSAQRLESLNLSPVTLADTVRQHFRDTAAGDLDIAEQNWLVRIQGTSTSTDAIARMPVLTDKGEIQLGQIAEIRRDRAEAKRLVRFNGQPGIMLAVSKKSDANILDLVRTVQEFVHQRNLLSDTTGVKLALVDDQTEVTRSALRIMQRNAVLGLAFVLIVTWVFVGTGISLLTSMGIPFVLAGTFIVLDFAGQTINVPVLLGVVISLGMLVDDAVVVVESVYFRLQRGMETMRACLEALEEVAAPVTASVLTTMAAFLPLMLLPGILGKFMLVIPLVVTTALAISLVEAFWMLPAHVAAFRVRGGRGGRITGLRNRFLKKIRHCYAKLLVFSFRRTWLVSLCVVLLAAGAAFAAAGGGIKFDFFASDPIRLFYVNVHMPQGTTVDQTLATLEKIDRRIKSGTGASELRSTVSYAGQLFTEISPLFGSQYGQVLVSLHPDDGRSRSVDEIIDGMRESVTTVHGPENISFLRLAGGPPTSKPISIKVRGDDFDEIRSAVSDLKRAMSELSFLKDISDDDLPGQLTLDLRFNNDALRRSGVDPVSAARTVQLLVDGEVVSSVQDRGEKVEVRVLAESGNLNRIDDVLEFRLPTESGSVSLQRLFDSQAIRGNAVIRHYNFRRTITVEADIDKDLIDEVAANNAIRGQWQTLQLSHPSISLDFTGILDDINESLDAIKLLFLVGVGLIFLILGTQFKSYFQPLMILVSVLLAAIGVVLGLLVTGNPLSLYTLYGLVALAGISVNSAIVLISTANARLSKGMTVVHAIFFAARRRVVPILITTLTTIAGLFSLAAGLGGESLIWSPIATSIVWGLGFSTALTLVVVPLIYRCFMGFSHRVRASTS